MTTFDLFSAVRDGNTDIVRRLLHSKQCRARLNDRNEWGDTALHLAAEAGNSEICQMLIAAGASVTVRNNRGETCLHRAAVGGHVGAVRAIVGRDQDPDAVNSHNDAGYTALHHAAKHGSIELIEVLVKAGADRMIENNAGETPYMVAHKFQQMEAERLLLNVEQQHADRATYQMNRKEKDIIRAFLKAVKYASQLESRVRIVLIGDRGTGKTSVRKTLFGEAYDPEEKPSSGVYADLSITRIQFKQYREWVLQPASKADAHRLNLEYTDIIIDYILNFLQQPRITDDGLDPTLLQIEKDQVKNVNFDNTDYIIPELEFESSDEPFDSSEAVVTDEAQGDTVENSNEARSSATTENENDAEESQNSQQEAEKCSGSLGTTSTADPIFSQNTCAHKSEEEYTKVTDGGAAVANNEEHPGSIDHSLPDNSDAGALDEVFARDSIEYRLDANTNEDDRLVKDSTGMEQPACSDNTSSATTSETRSLGLSESTPAESTLQDQQSVGTTQTEAQSKTGSMKASMQTSIVFSRSKRELSRLLVEKMPLEILKRMVIRWPVGDEHHHDRSELNKNRLMLTVWDVSGDPVQQNFTPLFFSSRCVYVATHNLARRLDSPCDTYASLNLANTDGCVPTNAEVLEGWIGCATAFSQPLPSEPFRCTKKTPVLPPLIIACSHSDEEAVRENPVLFHQFFGRRSFDSYKRHLVESNNPAALRISSKYENDLEEGYSGHHLLRREIDYLARQMPYAQDSVPVQWVKFEQLIYGLREQKKVILLYEDLGHYISEHCDMSGPLQIQPVLSHFHDVGVIAYFYRHPELSSLVITKPQWLISALGSMITSTPGKWITGEVQNAFRKLSQEGVIDKDNLLLTYRCARMPQRYWYEMLFILNCMDLVCCHPSLHQQKALYLPCMVMRGPAGRFLTPTETDPAILQFTGNGAAIPCALFNQLVVRCIRSSQYAPVIHYQLAHIRLNETHHLILTKRHEAITFHVQDSTDQFCSACTGPRYEYAPHCSHIGHIIGEGADYMPSDNIASIIRSPGNSGTNPALHLSLPSEMNTLKSVCPRVLSFISENIQFLSHCWFPGINLQLVANIGEDRIVLDQYWRHTTLKSGSAPASVALWFQ